MPKIHKKYQALYDQKTKTMIKAIPNYANWPIAETTHQIKKTNAPKFTPPNPKDNQVSSREMAVMERHVSPTIRIKLGKVNADRTSKIRSKYSAINSAAFQFNQSSLNAESSDELYDDA